MQVKNPNSAFKAVTITLDTAADYEAFRRIIYSAVQELAFNDKEEYIASELYDAFDCSELE